jgi:hypothetical protein
MNFVHAIFYQFCSTFSNTNRMLSIEYMFLLQFNFKEDRECEKVCEKNYYPGNKTSLVKLNMMKKMIDQNYNHHWYHCCTLF